MGKIVAFAVATLSAILLSITWQHEFLTVNHADFLRVLPRLQRHGWRVVALSRCELSDAGRVAQVVIARPQLAM